MLNLLSEPWIPVRMASGEMRTVRPAEIVGSAQDDPPVRPAWGRPDLDAATDLLLVGLLQTFAPPTDVDAWKKWLIDPPTIDELDAHLAPHADAFELGGDGPRFQQDIDELDVKPKTIDLLLFDTAGEITVKKNADLFAKRVSGAVLSPGAAAIALFALQQMAPSGGAGHRTSLRGGGPMTTLLRCRTLWHSCWLNVIASRHRAPEPDSPAQVRARVLPWLGATRTSEKGAPETTPSDVDQLQAYWGQPRRIRLDLDNTRSGRCLVTGAKTERGIAAYWTQNYGTSYGGAWVHPLSPYRVKNEQPLAMKAKASGIDFRDYVGYVVAAAKDEQRPASAVRSERVRQARRLARHSRQQLGEVRVAVSGLETDKAKVRGWQQSTLPTYDVDESRRTDWESLVQRLIESAGEACKWARVAVHGASGLEYGGTEMSTLNRSFYGGLEHEFYRALGQAASVRSDEEEYSISERWLRLVSEQSIRAFDGHATVEQSSGADLAQVCRERNRLLRTLRGPKLRKILALPPPLASEQQENHS